MPPMPCGCGASAQASSEINLGKFNQGDYFFATVEDKNYSENVSRVLYPYDSAYSGRELWQRQEYFLVSTTVQDILNRHWLLHNTFDNLGDKIAIHLNNTHPVLAIPELMRLLIDEYKFDWARAWEVVCQAFPYTNHTLMSEALEIWPAVITSHKVNGVYELYIELMVQSLFADFARLFPDRFCNKTNGVTQRRWLNPPLSTMLDETIGHTLRTDLGQLEELKGHIDFPTFIVQLQQVKLTNKKQLAAYLANQQDEVINPAADISE